MFNSIRVNEISKILLSHLSEYKYHRRDCINKASVKMDEKKKTYEIEFFNTKSIE